CLDHVDELIAAGTLGGEELNAADFQIGTTTRVLLNLAPLRPLTEGRPAAEHALRVAPRFGREAPLDLPPGWVPPPPAREPLAAASASSPGPRLQHPAGVVGPVRAVELERPVEPGERGPRHVGR